MKAGRLYSVVAGLLLSFVFVGFARTYFLKGLFGTPELPFYLHLHGLVLTTWFALLVVQTQLVGRGRTDWHRRLGVAGLVVAAGAVVTGAVTSGLAFPRHVALAGGAGVDRLLDEDAPLIFGNVMILVFFTILVAAAVYFRRRPALHKRLMIVASVSLVGPAIDRLWMWAGVELAAGVLGPLTLLTVVVAIIVWDGLEQKRLPRVLIAGFGAMLVFGFAGMALGTTPQARSWLLSRAGSAPGVHATAERDDATAWP